jgi:transcriptional regulator with XRE-family HTH domain
MILKEYNSVNTNVNDVVNNLKSYLSSNGYSKQDFIMESGMSIDKLNNILDGKISPTNHEINLIRNVMNTK